MDVALLLVKGRGQGRSFPLPGELVTIGRGEACDLRIPLGDVSRKHCTVLREGDKLTVQDLGSSNGTYVNGNRALESPLSAGDTLHIGPLTFVVQVDGEPSLEATRERLQHALPEKSENAGSAANVDALLPTAQSDIADLNLHESDAPPARG